ncbi:ribosomal protein S5 domain 2-type protein [Annulohypoxylon maeteangense]|uniref:ribosomal protein S5 domain 2-type protein n=1 Tax=Annulohypoxylon maeteangense TaxID=1927788 RepID=UPI0020081063|nr:ribosomal protein S5 domain 2-type protein [Annulohypoxylon maeteangense]KAI0885301.1 ribosomal protein S5 domain 2-type protein [Annulohypoxylon maeteangense]
MSSTTQHLLLSPAELAYLHSTLRLTPPVRPDGRTATQFRPLTAETGVLPGANGSARICFADGTEAIVGVKAEVEKRARVSYLDYFYENKELRRKQKGGEADEGEEGENGKNEGSAVGGGSNDWVEITVEIPGYRDDDSSTVFLATMLSEALLADGEFTKKLRINRRFHWKLYIDIILISPPLSYPLPLLSLTTHLALLATRLPRLKSEADEDPMFDDDWAASQFIYPRKTGVLSSRPPITLLVMAVGDNIIFDPSKEELAVADSALAVSVGERLGPVDESQGAMDVDGEAGSSRQLRLLSVRTIDPPSRLTAPGVPNAVNAAAWGQGGGTTKDPGARTAETDNVEGVWKAPRGGAKVAVLGAMVQKVLEKGGVADEVLEGLDAVDLG